MKHFRGIPMLIALSLNAPLAAQQRDSVRPFPLNPLVVTAERVSLPLASSMAAVSLLTSRELMRRPVRTLAEALQQAPGLAFVDFEGTGADPQLMTRGFYGGGEAEYVLLLLDGQPINSIESGRVNWDLIPLSTVQSIEVVRGPSSAAWGDAAIGGVINVLTRRDGGNALRGSFSGGEHGVMRAAAGGFGALGTRAASAFGNYAASDGFRDHAERSSGGVNASVALSGTAERGVSLTTFHDWRAYDESGPLTGAELQGSRTQSSPFYRFDHADERLHRLGFDGRKIGQDGKQFSGSLTGEYRHSDRVRTLRLAPGFADTKERLLTSTRLLGSAAFESPLAGGRFLFGVDASFGHLTSEYFGFVQGPAAVYSSAAPSRGDLDGRASGDRLAGAAFARYDLELLRGLHLSLGSRVDGLRDAFETDEEPASRSASHVELSPRGGLNYRYAGSARHQGHLYATVSKSFKAATPDQLYDRRKVPVPFDPFEITFANSELQPQHGLNYEAGLYHGAVLLPDVLAADLTVAAYQMNLEDELDFDITTLSYRNIGKSRHRGLELGLNLHGPATLTGFTSYTLQAATSQVGDDAGKYLKAIPRHFLVAGIAAGQNDGLLGSVTVTRAQRMFLDDANTETLPDWTRWDARLTYTWRALQVFADLYNLADKEFSTTGFPDPAGTGEVYYYPAAGRTLHVGLRWQR